MFTDHKSNRPLYFTTSSPTTCPTLCNWTENCPKHSTVNTRAAIVRWPLFVGLCSTFEMLFFIPTLLWIRNIFFTFEIQDHIAIWIRNLKLVSFEYRNVFVLNSAAKGISNKRNCSFCSELIDFHVFISIIFAVPGSGPSSRPRTNRPNRNGCASFR